MKDRGDEVFDEKNIPQEIIPQIEQAERDVINIWFLYPFGSVDG